MWAAAQPQRLSAASRASVRASARLARGCFCLCLGRSAHSPATFASAPPVPRAQTRPPTACPAVPCRASPSLGRERWTVSSDGAALQRPNGHRHELELAIRKGAVVRRSCSRSINTANPPAFPSRRLPRNFFAGTKNCSTAANPTSAFPISPPNSCLFDSDPFLNCHHGE